MFTWTSWTSLDCRRSWPSEPLGSAPNVLSRIQIREFLQILGLDPWGRSPAAQADKTVYKSLGADPEGQYVLDRLDLRFLSRKNILDLYKRQHFINVYTIIYRVQYIRFVHKNDYMYGFNLYL